MLDLSRYISDFYSLESNALSERIAALSPVQAEDSGLQSFFRRLFAPTAVLEDLDRAHERVGGLLTIGLRIVEDAEIRDTAGLQAWSGWLAADSPERIAALDKATPTKTPQNSASKQAPEQPQAPPPLSPPRHLAGRFAGWVLTHDPYAPPFMARALSHILEPDGRLDTPMIRRSFILLAGLVDQMTHGGVRDNTVEQLVAVCERIEREGPDRAVGRDLHADALRLEIERLLNTDRPTRAADCLKSLDQLYRKQTKKRPYGHALGRGLLLMMAHARQ
ncbi:MAG: hypothetical protein ACPGYL_13470, partial [Rhodospirillaceae bacterium]